MSDYPQLKLENQLCFPLYAVSKEIIRRYKPLLEPYGLTYTQYITMMVLWEKGSSSVNELGEKLLLDSGTLTPLLKKLEAKEYISRDRDSEDERKVTVNLTATGKALQSQIADVPIKLGNCIPIKKDDVKVMYELLYKVLENFKD